MSTEVALLPAVTPEDAALPPAVTPEEAAVSSDATPEEEIVIWASWDEALALNDKARGEVAEMILVPKLMSMGLIVAKPFGESSPWDLVVQADNKLSRLQVKSAWGKGKGRYQINAGPSTGRITGRRCYGANEIDFLVAYVAPEEAWFVFPVRELRQIILCIRMGPDCPFAAYRDRWDLLYGNK